MEKKLKLELIGISVSIAIFLILYFTGMPLSFALGFTFIILTLLGIDNSISYPDIYKK